MERRVFMIEIFTGTEEQYDAKHDEIWPEMEDALLRSGYVNYSLFRSGITVIGYVECHPNIAEAGRKMSLEPISKLWNDSMSGIINYQKTDLLPVFTEVWHLNESAHY